MTNTKLVSLESVMEILEKQDTYWYDGENFSPEWIIYSIDDKIKQLPTQEAQEWISVEERLPDEWRFVLILTNSNMDFVSGWVSSISNWWGTDEKGYMREMKNLKFNFWKPLYLHHTK